jgi:anaerobic selenocysteine-containing dehydrogenase/Fe-S-cluster-containing dehydrogenase component
MNDDRVVFDRRDFLKLVGIGVAGVTAGCGKPPAEKLIPYLVAPEDILPGVPYFYASTCRECPAGCGLIVRTREGRAIKLEGNPAHPVNHGRLCARGQAGLQGLYDPDRIKTPLVKDGAGWKTATWDEAIALVGGKLAAAKNRTVLLTGLESGSMRSLAGEFGASVGAKHVMWEPFGFETLRAANRATYGVDAVPRLDVAAARCLIAFGADLLETFLSPVAQAHGYSAMRARREDGGGHFVTVEPRLSATGANADEWVAAKPGTEFAVALGIANVIVAEGLGPAASERAALRNALADWTPEKVAALTDVPAETITRLARLFTQRSPSLAVAGGIATQGTHGTALAAAVNVLNHVAGNTGRTVRFDRTPDLGGLATFAQFSAELAGMAAGNVDVLLVHGANPAYAAPDWAPVKDAFLKVPFKVALATARDETTELCDVILPISHALESFGDAWTVRGVYALQQPAMKRLPMFDSRPLGDALIAAAKAAGGGKSWPDTYHDYLQSRWKALHPRFGNGRDFETFWAESLAAGGVFEDVAETPVQWSGTPAFAASERSGPGEFALLLTPSNNFYDGRGANRPWLQELPDMTSKTVWGSWAEVHPETAKALGVEQGKPIRVETSAGSVEVPAYLYAGIRKDTVAIALGQGHTAYGRYASNRGVNPVRLLPRAMDDAAGAVAYQGANAKLSRATSAMELYFQQSEKHQHDRHIAQIVPLAALLAGTAGESTEAAKHAAGIPHGDIAESEAHQVEVPGHYPAGDGVHTQDSSMTRPGKFTAPKQRPPGWQPPAHAITAYTPELPVRHGSDDPVNVGSYANAKHRWAMSVDLNSCTGCAACVVACNAENNIPIVGPDLVRRGREMQWIRIDRFEEKVAPGPNDVRFVPMMCQHCGNAPCEMVCPVYATYHNPEGLNAQVYNRCVGTRYCSNNCPYKVRVFNWFDYSAPEKTTFAFPEPLNWQLNPDVTVRSKGVMEKCTMCIQRILEGKGNAKDESRSLRDGEIQTACAQTCPTDALTFGDLMDPESAVHQKSFGERKYWVFEELYTKPGVTYLQKVTRDTTGGEA